MPKDALPAIDVDHPAYAPARGAIESHSALAPVYKFRPPYSKGFFAALADRLQLTRESVLLDLCCGRGELSAGLGASVARIHAVDGAPEMIDHAIPVPNAVYHVADVNHALPSAIGHVDHILIGSAIHWVRRDALRAMIAHNLKPGGKIAVTHRQIISGAQPYHQALAKLNERFGERAVEVEMQGRAKLAHCGFVPADKVDMAGKINFDVATLHRYQLSKAYYAFYDAIAADPAGYERQFHEAIAPFASGGLLTGTLANWAIIYQRAR